MRRSSLIKLSETSEILNVHPNTLRRWDKKGILSAVRFGERLDRHYSYDDVIRLLAKSPKNADGKKENLSMTIALKNMLQRINISASKFLVPLDPQQTYKIVIDEAKKLLKTDHGSVFLWDGKQLKRVYASKPVLFEMTPRKAGRTYSTFFSRKASVYYVKSKGEPHPMLKRLKVKSVIYIPLSYHGNAIGVINMLSMKNRVFSDEELGPLELFGTLASLAIVKAKVYNETKNTLENQKIYNSLVSHEIKTPITSIYAYTQLIKKRVSEKKPVPEAIVDKVLEETRRTTNLINDFLGNGFNLKQSPTSQYKRTSITSIIDRAISNFRLLYSGHRVVLKNSLSEKDTYILGHFDRLVQVFINLLNNAGKYSPAGSAITIRLSASKEYINISISDKGKGIAKKDLDNIFSKFYRGDGEEKEGMGLGLFLVKSIIKRHGGKIKVDSKLHKGSTFRVSLPKHNP